MKHLSYHKDEYEEMLKNYIEVKVQSGKNLAKSATLAWAMIHIRNNDTSGEIQSKRMTVQDRCGQSDDLPPVMQFYLLLYMEESFFVI